MGKLIWERIKWVATLLEALPVLDKLWSASPMLAAALAWLVAKLKGYGSDALAYIVIGLGLALSIVVLAFFAALQYRLQRRSLLAASSMVAPNVPSVTAAPKERVGIVLDGSTVTARGRLSISNQDRSIDGKNGSSVDADDIDIK